MGIFFFKCIYDKLYPAPVPDDKPFVYISDNSPFCVQHLLIHFINILTGYKHMSGIGRKANTGVDILPGTVRTLSPSL